MKFSPEFQTLYDCYPEECPHSQKRRFPKRVAKRLARESHIGKNKKLSAYLCRHCQDWHLTHESYKP